jgi:hypothetical protein
MDAANPAAWAALAFMHLILHHDEVFHPGLGFGAGYRPADPFVPRQRGDVFPHLVHLFISQNGFAYIIRQFVYGAAG